MSEPFSFPSFGHLPGARDLPDPEVSTGGKTGGLIKLRGFHRASGSWVTLASFNTAEEGEAAVRDCCSKTQPAPKQVAIMWEDFSAFRWEEMYTVRWVR